MSLLKRITRTTFMIRLRNWEYWPFGIIQFPAILYWLWLSIRARSLVFFSASNPGMPMGGMFGESKYEILMNIPAHLIPRTLLIPRGTPVKEVVRAIDEARLGLPLIFKPDIGERGYKVERITDEAEILRYVQTVEADFLVQECIDLPHEFGVFYMRVPGGSKGNVISLVEKEMLAVTGDGQSTLKELILAKDRAKLQWPRLRAAYAGRLDDVLPVGKTIELVSVGNHAVGTRFINKNHLINDRLSQTFDSISRQISGFYFGRYDLRCGSLEDLYAGNVKIMELNGCGAEPGHIYDANFSLWEALKVPVIFVDHMYRIARANRNRGTNYTSLREAIRYYRKFKSAVR